MKTLETERLILRKFKIDDFVPVHSYAGTTENIIYMLWGPNTEKQTKDFIDYCILKAEEIPCVNYQFAAVLKNGGKLIGACNLAFNENENDDLIEAEIGWILHRDYWKQGFGTEMGKALLRFGFEELNVMRLIAHCDTENYGSYRVMEKIGMKREGVFVNARPANKNSKNEFNDEYYYAISKEQWISINIK